jgi:hypothetical protein
MNIQFPTALSVARPSHRPATFDPPGAVGMAAGLRRNVTGRLLSFLPQSEMQWLMFKACISTASATALAIVGGIGLMVEAQPYFPLVPLAFIGLSLTTTLRVGHLFSRMAQHERLEKAAITMMSQQLGALEVELTLMRTMQILRRSASRFFSAAGRPEGIPAASGATVGDGGVVSPTVEAPNVIRPKSWRH